MGNYFRNAIADCYVVHIAGQSFVSPHYQDAFQSISLLHCAVVYHALENSEASLFVLCDVLNIHTWLHLQGS